MLQSLQNVLKNKDSVVVLSASIVVCLIGVFIGNNLHNDDDDVKPDVVSEIIKEDENDSSDSPISLDSTDSTDSLDSTGSSDTYELEKIDDLKNDNGKGFDDSTKDNIHLIVDEPENDKTEFEIDSDNNDTGKGIMNDDKNELQDTTLTPSALVNDNENQQSSDPFDIAKGPSTANDESPFSNTSVPLTPPIETPFSNTSELSTAPFNVTKGPENTPLDETLISEPSSEKLPVPPFGNKPVVLEEFGGKNRSKKNRKHKKSKKSRKNKK